MAVSRFLAAVVTVTLLGSGPRSVEPDRFLKYDDLVFVGSLVDVRFSNTTNRDWDLSWSPDEEFTMATMTFQAEEVLRGSSSESDIRVLTVDLSLAKDIPSRALICCYYAPRVLGGSYLLRDEEEVMVATRESNWRPLSGVGEMSIAEIRAAVKAVDVLSLAKSADLVVTGTVADRIDTMSVEINGASFRVAVRKLGISEVLRGEWTSDTVQFVTPLDPLPTKPWALRYCREMAPGQKWVLFLAKQPFGFVPLEGSNGMLRVSENSLIYENRSVRQITFEGLERSIRKMVRHENP
jgi:hypothetical protein